MALLKYFKLPLQKAQFLVNDLQKEYEKFDSEIFQTQKNILFFAAHSRLNRTKKARQLSKSENFDSHIIIYSTYYCQLAGWKKICISFCSFSQNLYLFRITVLRFEGDNPLTAAPFCAFILSEARRQRTQTTN